jgi:hypothetical protein
MTLLGLAAVCFLAGVSGAWWVQGLRVMRVQNEFEAYRLVVEHAATESARRALEQQQKWDREKENARIEADQRQAVLRTHLAAAVADAVELRDTVATLRGYLADASRPALIASATTLTELYQQCEADYWAMAAKAEGHVNDVIELRGACPRNGTRDGPAPTP